MKIAGAHQNDAPPFCSFFTTFDLWSKVLSLENERKEEFFFAFCSLICTFASNFVRG